MATPIDFDVIEALARAMFGQISPITGTRGTGTVTVTNPTGAAIELEKNSYMIPVAGGELAEDLVFKTAANPVTVNVHGVGGAWTIPPGGSLAVGVKSNLGGARHNLPAGTVFRFDPPQFGLDLTCTLDADIVDAADKADEPAVRRAVYYEELDAGALERDIQSGRLSPLPGVLLVWKQSTPAEGRTAGTNQGSTRMADGVRVFAENYTLFIVVASLRSDGRRRSEGLRLMQAITLLLTDQQSTRDFEQLTGLGSLEILGRARFVRGPGHNVYSISLRMNRAIRRIDERTFVPWLRTSLRQALPARDEPEPGEPTTPKTVVDIGVPIPPGPLGP